jgi:hypothetical protein
MIEIAMYVCPKQGGLHPFLIILNEVWSVWVRIISGNIMSQTIAIFFASLPFVLCGGFLISILCGFFEDRTLGSYHFRLKRFLAVFAIIFALNASSLLAIIPKVKNRVLDASHIAKTAVLKNRALSEYTLENLSVIFPEILNDKNKKCYRTALSNYVEDDWNKSFNTAMWQREESFCKKNPSACNGKEDDYFEAIRNKVNPFHLLLRDFGVIGYFLGTDWTTAAESYKKVRQFARLPDGKGIVPPPPDEQMLTNYHNYFGNCSSLDPMPWASTKDQLLKSEAVFCIGRCP